MKYTLVEKLDNAAVSRLIEEARNAELSRNFEVWQKVFEEVWSNIENEPDFSEFEESQQAELYRLAGYFLSNVGKVKNLPFYQERGKDLLTKAITFFSRLNNKDRVAEANIMLALCYFYEGAIIECESILDQAEVEFDGSHLNPRYLQIRIHQLITLHLKREFQNALKIIDEIIVPMEFCADEKLCSLFHQKAGLIYRGIHQYDKAIYHYHQAIRFAEDLNNLEFICNTHNNLAFLYNKTREFELAHLNSNEAIDIAYKNDFIGWLPHFLDTKALIYFDEGHYELSLQTIDEAISIFKRGEDANGLTESLWNKCKFLLHQNRKEEAILLFTEMIPIASQQMGEFAVKNFTKEFSALIHIKQGGSLDEETKRFRRVEIVNAILEADYKLQDAAELLKINLEALTKILDKEFPELYDELDILHQKKLDDNFIPSDENTTFSAPKHINRLVLQKVEIIFENETPKNFETFYFSTEKMFEAFGILGDAVIAVSPISNFAADEFVLVRNTSNNSYLFGKTEYDKDLNLHFLVDQNEPMPLSLDDVQLIGKAIAFCPFDEIDNDKLVFQSLNSVKTI